MTSILKSSPHLIRMIVNYYAYILCLGIFLLTNLDIQGQELLWAKRASSSSYQYGVDADIDSEGNMFVVGHGANSTMYIGNDTVTSNGISENVFIIKFDTEGELLWFKSLGAYNNYYNDSAEDIHIDNNDDVYITIRSNGHNLTYNGDTIPGVSSNAQYGGQGVIFKIDNDGDYLWHDAGSQASRFNRVVTDSNDNVYLTGWFRYSTIIGDSITLENPTNGTTSDMFIAKYSSSGNIEWAKNAGGTIHNAYAYGNNIAIHEQSDKIIVAGRCKNNIIFETDTLIPPFSNVAFLAAYNTSGTELWVKTIFDIYPSYCNGLDISKDGLVGVVGHGSGSISTRGFLGFYDLDGNIQSEEIYGPTFHCSLNSIKFNEENECFISGAFGDSVTIGNTFNDTTLYPINPYNRNGMLFKLDSTQVLLWANQMSSTHGNRIISKNGRVVYSGRFDDPFIYNYNSDTILVASDGLGDAIFAELCDATFSKDIYVSCDDLVWMDGNTYTTSNNSARYILTNSEGCDSIIQLDYTRLLPVYSVDSQMYCDSFTWIDGVVYTESNNTATYTITNANGCDSIITLDLTIGVEDVETMVVDSTISASLAGVTYQWLDCTDGYSVILGAITQSYSPENNGTYAVEITQNGCVDTSECQSINVINTPEYNGFEGIKLYPNPSSDVFNIDFIKELEEVKLIVTNLQGQDILRQDLKKVTKAKINLQDQKSGVYLLSVHSNVSQKILLLVKH